MCLKDCPMISKMSIKCHIITLRTILILKCTLAIRSKMQANKISQKTKRARSRRSLSRMSKIVNSGSRSRMRTPWMKPILKNWLIRVIPAARRKWHPHFCILKLLDATIQRTVSRHLPASPLRRRRVTNLTPCLKKLTCGLTGRPIGRIIIPCK